MDTVSKIIQAIAYIQVLLVLALLWHKVVRSSETRPFWSLLAAALTMNLLGNIAWFVYEYVTGTALDSLSIVDLFLVSRYVLIGCAFWLYPAPLSRQTWLWIVGAMLAASVIARLIYFNPVMILVNGDWTYFPGLIMYLVLDAGIIVLAWLRVRSVQRSGWSRYAFLLLCSMTSYGIANTINLTEYIFSWTSSGILQSVFWIVADLFVLVVTLRADAPGENENPRRQKE